MDFTTFFSQTPTHAPTSRKAQLLADLDAFDKRRCIVVDTDPELAAEMWLAYLLVEEHAEGMCDHTAPWHVEITGSGPDAHIIHTCLGMAHGRPCDTIMAIE